MIAAILSLACFVVALLPDCIRHMLARSTGWLWATVFRIRRRVALKQLEATGVARGRAAGRIYLRVCQHQVLGALELLAWRRWKRRFDADGVPAWLEIEGVENLETALARDRGVILATGHFGVFDLMACALGRYRKPVMVLTKTLSAAGVSEAWMRVREGFGLQLIPIDLRAGAPRSWFAQATDLLASGGSVVLVIDQHSRERRAIEHRFLGLPARTTRALGVLAARSGAPVLPVYSSAGAAKRPHHVRFGEPIILADADFSTQVERVTLDASRVLEQAIREAPEQWLWLHKRWKTSHGHWICDAKEVPHARGESRPDSKDNEPPRLISR